MQFELTPKQQKDKKKFRNFAQEYVQPYEYIRDTNQHMTIDMVDIIKDSIYPGSIIPEEYGGPGMDMLTYGILCEEIGKVSASLISLFAVHGMISRAILQWGSDAQKTKWLPELSKGKTIGAFALSEPDIGSDAANIQTKAIEENDHYILNGQKKWISCGRLAGLFLIIASLNGKPSAFLVEKDTPGFSTELIDDMIGFRSAMLAQLDLDNVKIPKENLVGREGFGFSHVAGAALDHGRYCIACGCTGLAQACLEASMDYINSRKQGGVLLKEHQLIQQMISNMITNIKASRLLCYNAGYLKDIKSPDSIMETTIAKYFASTMANKVASDAVQIQGANGCRNKNPVARHFRDAKIMEIIEGSSQIQQIIISKYGYQAC